MNLVEASARTRLIGALPERLRQDAGDAANTIGAQIIGYRNRNENVSSSSPSTALALSDPEPWVGPIDGAVLLDSIAALFDRYVVLAADQAVALALWVLHSHAHEAAFCSPVLAITSAEKRCGKTQTISVLSELVPRPLSTANTSASAFFRIIQTSRPTLIIDEGDTFLADRDELRGMLNSGHTRTAAFVLRTVGDDLIPHKFSTWAPKAIAMIGHLPDTLADRSILIRLRRRLREEVIARLRPDRLTREAELIRRQAWTWTQGRLDSLKDRDPSLPEALHDRQQDNWRSMIAIADEAGGNWPARARAASVTISKPWMAADTTTLAHRLLSDLRELVTNWNGGQGLVPTKTIIEHLVALPDAPWREYQSSKDSIPRVISERSLAQLLQPYEIPHVRTEAVRGYAFTALLDAVRRFAPNEASEVSSSDAVGL